MTIDASFIYSLKAPLNHWLKLQSQMIGICTQSVLVNRAAESRYQLMAQWPTTNAMLDSDTEHAIIQVLAKQRLHLSQVNAHTLLLCHPVTVNDIFWGAVILCIRCEDKKTMPALIKKLQSGLVWLQLILQSYTTTQPHIQMQELPATSPTDPANTHNEKSLQLLTQLMQDNSLRESAITLANALATQLQAARVSIALLQKNILQIEAVSFSANFDSRTESMQVVVRAMNEAIEQGRMITYSPALTLTADSSGITRCHQQLVETNQLLVVRTYLLTCSGLVLGAVTIEQKKYNNFNAAQEIFIDQSLNVAAQVLQLKILAEHSVFQRAKNRGHAWLGRMLGENNVVRKILLALSVAFLLMLFVPVQYHISSEANLQGAYKNLLVSPQDGFLREIKARPGDRVKKGDVLAQLNDDDLHVEYRKLASQMQQYQQEYDNALANGNRVQAAIANAQVDQASAQLQLIEAELTRTRLASPADGIIVSDDISQSLGAPVKQGQTLFEIAAATGFLVQIFVDERDIAAIKHGQEGHLKLTSLPGELLTFTVKKITPISQVREGRNYFRVEASLANESDILRPGMTGTAKIAAGKQLLGWIWFHDLWHWMRLKLWW